MAKPVRMDDLASKGMRLDVKPERAPSGVVQLASGTTATRESGIVEQESGMEPGAPALGMPSEILSDRCSSGEDAPSILNLAAGKLDGTGIVAWSGAAMSGGNQMHFGWETSDGQAYAPMRIGVSPYDAGPPLVVNDRIHLSATDRALGVSLFKGRDDEIHSRWAKLGYPPLSCDDSDSNLIPFLYVEDNNNDDQDYPLWGGNAATEGSRGCVGYSSARTFLEVCKVSDSEWNYGYAACGSSLPAGADKGGGWGQLDLAEDHAWEMKEFAVGYVFVYNDGTMSEPTVMKWKNTPHLKDPIPVGYSARLFVPFTHAIREPDVAVSEEELVVAFKGQIQVAKNVIERQQDVVGVRVFYNHRSTKREEDTFEGGYNGWTTDAELINNMREVFYLDEGDRQYGMCRIENATETRHDPFDAGYLDNDGQPGVAVYRFAAFLCPCELTIERMGQLNPVDDDSYDSAQAVMPRINNKMVLGQKWSAIRGDLADGTGTILSLPQPSDAATYGVTSPLVEIFETGRVVYSEGGVDDNLYESYDELPDGSAYAVSSRPEPTACAWKVGCVVGNRTVVSGVRFTHTPEDADYAAIYPCHMSPDGTPFTMTFPTALRIPIVRGKVVALAASMSKVFVGTEDTVYIVDMSGAPETWRPVDIQAPCGVAGPRAMVGNVGNRVFWIGKDRHVYMYELGSDSARQRGSLTAISLTRGVEDILSGDYASPTHDYVITYDHADDAIIADAFKGYVGGKMTSYDLAIRVCNKTLGVSLSNKVILGSASHSGVTYITSGNAVFYLSDGSIRLWFPHSEVDFNYASVDFQAWGLLDEANDDIGMYSIEDADLHEDAGLSWVEGNVYRDPALNGVLMGVAYYFEPPTDGGINPVAYARMCAEPRLPVAVTGYDGKHIDGPTVFVGRLLSSDPMWDFVSVIAKDGSGCYYPNMWYTWSPTLSLEDGITGEYREIPMVIEKELVVDNGTRRIHLDGFEIAADIATLATDVVVSVTFSDPSGRSAFPTRTITFSTGSVLHRKGRAYIPCKSVGERVKVTISVSGGLNRRVSIRHIEPIYRDGGKVKLS